MRLMEKNVDYTLCGSLVEDRLQQITWFCLHGMEGIVHDDGDSRDS